MRQTSRHAADCRFARPPAEGFVSGLRRTDFAARRHSATRRLGPYRDRTFTGKLIRASLDTPPARHSGNLPIPSATPKDGRSESWPTPVIGQVSEKPDAKPEPALTPAALPSQSGGYRHARSTPLTHTLHPPGYGLAAMAASVS